jgi:TRAP-type C4-dicarboxylate transport system permease small subunit
MRPVVRVIEALSDAAGYLAGATVLGLTALITSAVVARRVFGAPILAADEVSGYLLLAIVFFGLAHTMKAGGHIRADIVLTHVPLKVRALLELLATVLAIGFALALLGGAWALLTEYYGHATTSFKYLQIPLWMPASLLVVGAALLALQLVAQLLPKLRGPSEL